MAKFKVYGNTYQQGQLVKRNILHIASYVHPEEKVKIQNYAKTHITEDDANRLRKLQHNIPLEVLMSITKAIHPLMQYLNNNFSGTRNGIVNGATFSLSALAPYQDYAKYVAQTAEKIKAKYQVLEDLAKSGATKEAMQASARSINAEIKELVTQLNDKLGKLTNLIFSEKMNKFYKTLNSNKRAIKLAKEGALVESVEDMKYLKYASKFAKGLAGGGIVFTFGANYYDAYQNTKHGADPRKEFGIASTKSASEIAGSAIFMAAAAILLAPETGGLSLLLIAGGAGVAGSLAGDGFNDKFVVPFLDNWQKTENPQKIQQAYQTMFGTNGFA